MDLHIGTYEHSSDREHAGAGAVPPAHSMLASGLRLLADDGLAGTPLHLSAAGSGPTPAPSLLWASQPGSTFTDAAAVVITELWVKCTILRAQKRCRSAAAK